MSTLVEPSTSTPQRRHRGKRPQGQNVATSLQDGAHTLPHTTKPKRQQNHMEAQNRIISDVQDDLVSPLTPPHTAIDKIEQSTQKTQGSSSAKKRASRGKKGAHGASPGIRPILPNPIQPVSTRKESPQLEKPQATPTAVKQATQMYAGPTFHASPAPSTLPIPKFFSRPEPPEDKIITSDFTSPDDTSSQENSSARGDESPPLRNPTLAGKLQTREPSPLDIFFKADREEKARLSQNSPQRASSAVDRAKSASPSVDSFKQSQSELRQHNRRQTESLYPLSSSGNEDTKAKTAALKQLLLIPNAKQSPVAPLTDSGPPLKTPNQSYDRPHVNSSTPQLVFSSRKPVRSESSLLDSPDISLNDGDTRQPRRPLPYHIRQDLINKLPLN